MLKIKKHNSLSNLIEEEEEQKDQNKNFKHSQGITERLLEKYKPSKGFVVIEGSKEEFAGPKAA